MTIDMDSEITSFLHGSECEKEREREREKEREMELVGEGKKIYIYIYVCARFLQVGVGRNGFGSSEMLDA